MVEHFIPASSIHSYGTRFRVTGCFSIPTAKSFGKKSFGCVLWNELHGDIRILKKYPNFKEAVKKFLLSKIDWECMFLQFLDTFCFPSSIDLYGFKVYTSFLNYCFNF